MNILFVPVFLAALAQNGSAAAPATTADPQAGKTLWEMRLQCRNCHGPKGEGAYGPDLAGRSLSLDQFRQAVRKPWGVMPAYTDAQVSDQDVAALVAYFDSLPRVSQPGPWRTPLPANAPPGQQLLIATAGCGQCHGPDLASPRQEAGGAGADFEWFAKRVYTHTDADEEYVKGRMGNFSKTRLPEALLKEIWQFASVDLGLRVPVRARIMPSPAGNGYSLTVENRGLPGKGLTAEDVTIAVALPADATVTRTSGDGYQGVRSDPQTGMQMAVWQVARLAPTDSKSYSITLTSTAPGGTPPKGNVRWMKPTLGTGANDSVPIVSPPPGAPQRTRQ